MRLNEEKFFFGAVSAVLIIGAWILTAFVTSLAPTLTTVVGGLTGVYALFVGGHVTNRWVEGRAASGQPGESEMDASADEEMTPDEQAIAALAARA